MCWVQREVVMAGSTAGDEVRTTMTERRQRQRAAAWWSVVVGWQSVCFLVLVEQQVGWGTTILPFWLWLTNELRHRGPLTRKTLRLESTNLLSLAGLSLTVRSSK